MEGNGMEEIKDMTPRLLKDLGMRYPTEKSTKKARYGLYECAYCGKEFEAQVSHIKNGNTKSCGCLVGIWHGLHNNKFYKTWNDMIRRCTNQKATGYKDYGGRGITVCEEWLDIKNFVDWAERTYPNTKGVSLDRIDNGKGYSPENCRWADRTTQNINQRMQKNNTSGFVGIYWHIRDKRWVVNIGINKKLINIGSSLTKEDAVLARDNYIIENNLSHKLSTEYKKEKINE